MYYIQMTVFHKVLNGFSAQLQKQQCLAILKGKIFNGNRINLEFIIRWTHLQLSIISDISYIIEGHVKNSILKWSEPHCEPWVCFAKQYRHTLYSLSLSLSACFPASCVHTAFCIYTENSQERGIGLQTPSSSVKRSQSYLLLNQRTGYELSYVPVCHINSLTMHLESSCDSSTLTH